MRAGFLVFPGITQLDMTGPHEVFARMPGAEIHLVWKTLDAVTAQSGMRLVPTTTLYQEGISDRDGYLIFVGAAVALGLRRSHNIGARLDPNEPWTLSTISHDRLRACTGGDLY